MRIFFIVFAFLFIAVSCNKPKRAARQYCNCLEEFESNIKPAVAFDICDARIFTKYKELEYYNYNLKYEHLYGSSDKLKDNAIKFEAAYFDYLVLFCCDKVGKCALKNDSAYLKTHPILQ